MAQDWIGAFLEVPIGFSQIVGNWIESNCMELSNSIEFSNHSIKRRKATCYLFVVVVVFIFKAT